MDQDLTITVRQRTIRRLQVCTLFQDLLFLLMFSIVLMVILTIFLLFTAQISSQGLCTVMACNLVLILLKVRVSHVVQEEVLSGVNPPKELRI